LCLRGSCFSSYLKIKLNKEQKVQERDATDAEYTSYSRLPDHFLQLMKRRDK
jgi:hypothetical protein